MSNMLLLKSDMENMGLCRLLNHQHSDVWLAITLSGRTILVKVIGNEAIELRK